MEKAYQRLYFDLTKLGWECVLVGENLRATYADSIYEYMLVVSRLSGIVMSQTDADYYLMSVNLASRVWLPVIEALNKRNFLRVEPFVARG